MNLIRTLHSFLNKSVNIIGRRYNRYKGGALNVTVVAIGIKIGDKSSKSEAVCFSFSAFGKPLKILSFF